MNPFVVIILFLLCMLPAVVILGAFLSIAEIQQKAADEELAKKYGVW